MTTKKSVKKMYCRMFQSVMKAGISTIPWRTPKLMKGAGAVRHLPAAIKRRGLKKALIVTGPTLIGRGLLDGVLEEMEEQGLLYVIYNKVEQNPTDENVEDAAGGVLCRTGIYKRRSRICSCDRPCGRRIVWNASWTGNGDFSSLCDAGIWRRGM